MVVVQKILYIYNHYEDKKLDYAKEQNNLLQFNKKNISNALCHIRFIYLYIGNFRININVLNVNNNFKVPHIQIQIKMF